MEASTLLISKLYNKPNNKKNCINIVECGKEHIVDESQS